MDRVWDTARDKKADLRQRSPEEQALTESSIPLSEKCRVYLFGNTEAFQKNPSRRSPQGGTFRNNV